jgi:hypothetical protein
MNVMLSVKNYTQNKVSVAKPCRSCREIMIFSEKYLTLIPGKRCQKFRGNRIIWIVMMPEIQICKKERHERRGFRTITVVLAKHKNGSLMMVPA